jgi:hypothetical protein
MEGIRRCRSNGVRERERGIVTLEGADSESE